MGWKKEREKEDGISYSAGIYAAANITGTVIAVYTPHTATLVNPICAKRFHRHYGGQSALWKDHYCCVGHAKQAGLLG